ncbi:MAG: hypothetical protein IH588_17775 [Anaerolineales bacterium]|nr:hypothetical protein [Anaerolineales bacterium]
MSLTLDVEPAALRTFRIKNAILETLAYSDVFDYPLTLDELHRFLTTSATQIEIQEQVADMKSVSALEGYYFLAGRSEIVLIRQQRERDSHKAYRRALFYGRILGGLPFIRMVALTGSLAMLNLTTNRDMDYMLVAKPGRVWTARAFALLLARIAHLIGDVICPNVIVSGNALEWSAKNLYTAHEFAQMISVSGGGAFNALRVVNSWIKDFLPNIDTDPSPLDSRSSLHRRFQFILECPLDGKFGDVLEAWEMNRKIARFKKQANYGAETNFSADVCQGNFNHHSLWTLKAYTERLESLEA